MFSNYKSVLKNLMVFLPISLIAGCQTSAVKEKLDLNTSLFPASTQNFIEKPTGAFEMQRQTITASNDGKVFGIIYLKAPGGKVWLRQVEELPLKHLLDWNRFKNSSINLGTYNLLKTSLGEVSYRKFDSGQNKCVYFGKYFGWASDDDTRRPTQLINGYVCSDSNVALSDAEIAELLNGITISKVQPKPEVTAAMTAPQSDNNASMKRSLSGVWKGVSDTVKGEFTSDSSTTTGQLHVQLDDANLNCTGQWLWAKGKFQTSELPQGTWSVACDNGLTAGGTYTSGSPTRGIVQGKDSKGRKITMYFAPA